MSGDAKILEVEVRAMSLADKQQLALEGWRTDRENTDYRVALAIAQILRDDFPRILAELEASRQRVAELKKALREYGGHAPGCKLPMTPCSCGWHELRATLTPKQEAK